MEPDPSSRKQAVTIGYILAAAIGMVLLQWVLATYNTVDTIPFSQFEQLVEQGRVSEVAVGQDSIEGKLRDKLPSGKSAFVTARVDPALAEKLEAKGVVVTGVPSWNSRPSRSFMVQRLPSSSITWPSTMNGCGV